jgi:hypothetical protein
MQSESRAFHGHYKSGRRGPKADPKRGRDTRKAKNRAGRGGGGERRGEKGGKMRGLRNSGKIVDAEVGVVFTDASCGFGYGFRFRESGSVD